MIKVGERLGRFELLRELGRGSHGVVFEANDTLLNERVAIKALQPWLGGDPTLRERFKRELILTRRVSHPGVCRLYDLHEDGDTLFISMQYVEGRSLSALLREDAPSLPRVVRLLRGICSALTAAHEQGVVHRDLKPANVVVDAKDHVFVLDFGIATAAGVGQLTRPGQALGSVPFIPPEVWEGQPASPLGDQYAIGVIGFAAATGTLPYRGTNPLEVADAIKGPQPSLRERWADVDGSYERVILRAMARVPAERFPDVRALDDALGQLEATLSLSSPSSSSSSSGAPTGASPMPSRSALPSPVTMQENPVPGLALTPGQSLELGPTPLTNPTQRAAAIDGGASSPDAGVDATVDNMEPLTISTGIIDVSPRSTVEGPSLDGPVAPAMSSAAVDRLPTRAAARAEPTVRVVRPSAMLTDMMPRLEREAARAAATAPNAATTAPAPTVAAHADDEPPAPAQRRALPLVAAAGVVIVALVVVIATRGADPPETVAGVDTPPVPAVALATATDPAAAPNAVAGTGGADVDDVPVVPVQVGVDAGSAPSDNAGLELAFGDGDLAAAPDPVANDPVATEEDADDGTIRPGGHVRDRRPARPSDAAINAVAAAARARGVRPGDVPALDEALNRGRRASEKAGVDKAAAQARAVLDGVVVDKAFVGKKLARFNTAFDAAAPAVQARVKPLTKDVAKGFSRGDWTGANARLNDAFDAMKKK